MKFELAPDVFLKEKKGKTLSIRTQKEYSGKLNKIAKLGWTDRAALKKNHKDIIKYIKDLYPNDDEKGRFNKRYIIYAIFWALDNEYISKANPYHKYLKTIPPITNSVSGDAWIPLADFRSNYSQIENSE